MGIVKENGFDFYMELDGKRILSVKGISLSEEIEYIKENKISCIALEPSLKEISFLKEIPFVEEVHLGKGIEDYSPMYHLIDLRRLTVNVEKKAIELDYSKFVKLEYLSIDWFSKFPNLSNNHGLKELVIWKFKPQKKSLEVLKLPNSLESLKITESDILNLEGLSATQLKKIEMYHCKGLRSVKGIETFKDTIEILILDYCRNLADYENLKFCKHLKKLILGDCGDIPSLNWLGSLKELKHFSFYNTKLIDGDLTSCLGIDYVSFRNSRTYNYKAEDFIK